jgi:hypothetical protein
MDRRLDERYQTNFAATVIDIADPGRIASGQIVNISQAGICANLSMRLSPNSIVRVQIGDCALFGHVAYSDDDPSFRTGIDIVRVLIGESDLSRLVRAVLAETMPSTPGNTAH